jgi:molybdopterin synthase catalytic subunit
MTPPSDVIELTVEKLSLDRLVAALGQDASGEQPGADREGGALVTFSGIVRAQEGSATIGHLDYEAYGTMALSEMRRVVERARAQWPLLRVGLVHRAGRVPVGEASVVVAVLAGHRAEAFEAARFLIDELKRSVPIWKSAPIAGEGNPPCAAS